MPSNNKIRHFLENCKVKKEIIDLLLSIFPSDSLTEYLPILKEAMDKPAALKNMVMQFEMMSGIGATSHIAIVARELLSFDNFHMFTRDYIRRCGDLVELFVKTLLVNKLPLCSPKKSLGANVRIMQKRYNNLIPKELLDALYSFDSSIYRRAKHEFVGKETKLYNVADAVAVTFIALRLCQKIEDISKSL